MLPADRGDLCPSREANTAPRGRHELDLRAFSDRPWWNTDTRRIGSDRYGERGCPDRGRGSRHQRELRRLSRRAAGGRRRSPGSEQAVLLELERRRRAALCLPMPTARRRSSSCSRVSFASSALQAGRAQHRRTGGWNLPARRSPTPTPAWPSRRSATPRSAHSSSVKRPLGAC